MAGDQLGDRLGQQAINFGEDAVGIERGLQLFIDDALMRGDKKQVRSVGVYLGGQASPGRPKRVDVLTDRLVTIATQLKV